MYSQKLCLQKEKESTLCLLVAMQMGNIFHLVLLFFYEKRWQIFHSWMSGTPEAKGACFNVTACKSSERMVDYAFEE